jgi:hypothetical protein
VKSLIGKFLVAGLLSGSALFAAASPSSALPRDPCMDQTNYDLQYQYYEDTAFHYYDVWDAWQNADHYVNPLSGQEVWSADEFGFIVSVYRYQDYTLMLSGAQNRYNTAYANWANFVDRTTIC